MIKINKSATSNLTTEESSNINGETLLSSTVDHIYDVQRGVEFLVDKLTQSAIEHDRDKIENFFDFHENFKDGFKTKYDWWNNHKETTRHHLQTSQGVPEDVNLLDILEMITDCVMAGTARSGSVRPVEIDVELLQTAVYNTVELLKNEITLVD